jgi:phage gpG-like protein
LAKYNRFEFDKVMQRFEFAKIDVPVRIANVARNYFVNSFTVGGFDGKKWKEVQRRIPGTKAYKYPKNSQLSRRTNPILVGTYKGRSGGNLRRQVNNSIRRADFFEIRLGVSAPYAQYHNEGTDKIPQRKFMGESRELNATVKKNLQTLLKKVF